MTESEHHDSAWHLFEAIGVELEYMIVDRQSLNVRPLADELLRDDHGRVVSDVEFGAIAWSNELVAHVVELKTNGPATELDPLTQQFQTNVETINCRLADRESRLLPTAMHPWMNPNSEMVLWPHECSEIYATFNRIFDCRGHGWANLQSMHLNFPFCGDDEFGRLHAAIRLLLPLLPALAASSPIMDGRPTGRLDNRLEVYRTNSARIPMVAGRVIPEPVFDRAAYDREIFQPMFQQIAPYDSRGVLQDEFLNARGAIARFSRGAIEIRLLDVQECPQADIAIATLIVEVLKLLVAEHWTETADQQSVGIDPLETVLLAAINDAEQAIVESPDVMRHFGVTESSVTLQELWQHLLTAAAKSAGVQLDHSAALQTIVHQGPLARRMLQRLPATPEPSDLYQLYAELANCLQHGQLLV